jgi:hypothetical protein
MIFFGKYDSRQRIDDNYRRRGTPQEIGDNRRNGTGVGIITQPDFQYFTPSPQ